MVFQSGLSLAMWWDMLLSKMDAQFTQNDAELKATRALFLMRSPVWYSLRSLPALKKRDSFHMHVFLLVVGALGVE